MKFSMSGTFLGRENVWKKNCYAGVGSRSNDSFHSSPSEAELTYSRRPKIKCGVWCRWNKSGAYKLNFDGSAKDNLAAGGGFIRDVKGNYVAAFSAFYEKRDE